MATIHVIHSDVPGQSGILMPHCFLCDFSLCIMRTGFCFLGDGVCQEVKLYWLR